MTAGAPKVAAILAGGLGTRLRSVIADRPKVLAPVAGRPFITWILDKLARAGVQRTVLCTGFMAQVVRASVGDWHEGMEVLYSEEPHPLGTGGAVRLALPLLDASPVLVMNGDSWCGAPLEPLLAAHARHDARVTIQLIEVADARRYGTVDTDADDAVTAFREKDGAVGRAWINAGVYLFDRQVIAAIAPNRTVSMERDVLPGCIGDRLFAARAVAPFVDIGTPDSFAAAARVIQGEG